MKMYVVTEEDFGSPMGPESMSVMLVADSLEKVNEIYDLHPDEILEYGDEDGVVLQMEVDDVQITVTRLELNARR